MKKSILTLAATAILGFSLPAAAEMPMDMQTAAMNGQNMGKSMSGSSMGKNAMMMDTNMTSMQKADMGMDMKKPMKKSMKKSMKKPMKKSMKMKKMMNAGKMAGMKNG